MVGALLSSVTFVGQFVAVQQQNGSRSTLYEYPTTTTTTTSADTTTTTTTTDSVLYLRTTAADRWGTASMETNTGYAAAADTMSAMDAGVQDDDDTVGMEDNDDEKPSTVTTDDHDDVPVSTIDEQEEIVNNEMDEENEGEWNEEQQDVEEESVEEGVVVEEHKDEDGEEHAAEHEVIQNPNNNGSKEEGRGGESVDENASAEETAIDGVERERTDVVVIPGDNNNNNEEVTLLLQQDTPANASYSSVEDIANYTVDNGAPTTEENQQFRVQQQSSGAAVLLIHNNNNNTKNNHATGDVYTALLEKENSDPLVDATTTIDEVTQDVQQQVSEEVSDGGIEAKSSTEQADIVEKEDEVTVDPPRSEELTQGIDEQEGDGIPDAVVANVFQQSAKVQASTHNATAGEAEEHNQTTTTTDDDDDNNEDASTLLNSTTDSAATDSTASSAPLDFDEKLLHNTFMRSVKTGVVTTPGVESTE